MKKLRKKIKLLADEMRLQCVDKRHIYSLLWFRSTRNFRNTCNFRKCSDALERLIEDLLVFKCHNECIGWLSQPNSANTSLSCSVDLYLVGLWVLFLASYLANLN
jgi:hypothetical protein